ncbi:methyltransferase [Reyranella sp.]|uniref:methyltransferase n=1 Tax=Reyranella sp. TaxID=1929291 RepID=UPI00272EF491|nr:methyltransferase [Reyranella sp.]MDP2374378.1 methyltransferase [Reyranella sp.]
MDNYVRGVSKTTTTAPAIRARRLVFGHRITRLVTTAVSLHLPDHLSCEVAMSAAQIAPRVQADPRALHRLLRALASLDIVKELPDGRFILTDVGATLRTNDHGSIGAWILLEGSDFFQYAWSKLADAVQGGGVAFNKAHGMSFYQYLERHPSVAEAFHSTMSQATALVADAVVDAYEFRDAKMIVDVGGGVGTLLLKVLSATPTAHGILFDVPSTLARANENIEKARLSSRCETVGGDFFASVPGNGDVYLLSRIIMDYDDESAAQLLRKCREVMAPGGRILVLQQMLQPEGSASDWAAHFECIMSDIAMLVLETGRERTEQQYRQLFVSAGLSVSRVIPTRSPVSIVEGVRAHSA